MDLPQMFSFDVVTFSPLLTVPGEGVLLAALGAVGMYNPGGTVLFAERVEHGVRLVLFGGEKYWFVVSPALEGQKGSSALPTAVVTALPVERNTSANEEGRTQCVSTVRPVSVMLAFSDPDTKNYLSDPMEAKETFHLLEIAVPGEGEKMEVWIEFV